MPAYVAGGGSGAWGAASGAGVAGFGSNAGAYGASADQYDIVEIDEPSARVQTKVPGVAKNLDKKEASLAKKEAELQRREAELQRREAAVKAGGYDPMAIKNFPPFMPIVHHDISSDIPEGKRGLMRQGFMLLLGTMIALLFNFVCVLVAWITHAGDNMLSPFFFSLIYLVVGVPGAWFSWYRPLYKAMMRDGALSFAMFFLTFLVHLAFCIFTAVAPTTNITGDKANFAHAGLITALQINQDGHTLSFIFYIAGFAWWTLIAVSSFLFMLRVYATFRNQGGATAARQEATGAGVQMVQNDIIANAARNRV